MRHLAIALCLALLLGVLPATSVVAVDDEKERTPSSAVALSLDANTIMAHAQDQTVDLATTRAASYLKLNAAKAAQRELARQHRRDRRAIKREVAPALRKCQLANIDRAYQKDRALLQAEIVASRLELGYVNRQKGITKFTNRVGQFARFVGEVIKETLKDPPPQLLATLATGGGHKVVLKALGKRFTKIFKRRVGDELLAKVAGVRSRAVLAEAAAACQDPAAPGAPEGDTDESWDEALNRGPFSINSVYGYSPAYGRQGGAIMAWEGVRGPLCADFGAYNPHPMDPRNEKLPGIRAAVRFDPSENRFGGMITGKTASDDLSKGGKATGEFTIFVSGTTKDDEEGVGWLLEGQRSSVRLVYKATRSCGDGTKNWTEDVDKSKEGGPVKVSGRIRSGASDWELELNVERQAGGQDFSAWLKDIKLGPVILDLAPKADPAPAAADTPGPTASPSFVGSNQPAPWEAEDE